MRRDRAAIALLLVAMVLLALSCAKPTARGIAPESFTRPILDKTATIRLAPDLTGLPPSEQAVVKKLIAAGEIVQMLYERMLHHQADEARTLLATPGWGPGEARVRELRDLYQLNDGPIATTLDNSRVPFLPVDSLVPGCNVYPWGVTKDEVERYLSAHPGEREWLLNPRSVVRRAERVAVRSDLAMLMRHAELRALDPLLENRLRAITPAAGAFYAVPYSLAYADDIARISRLLFEAAGLADATDHDFARYLRHRARDLMANDYEAGDAAWVTAEFGRLNGQIGSYETYPDELYGVKAFHALSVLLEDTVRTTAVRVATKGLQSFENSLPIATHKKVREDISVGIYDVIADFGQSRGTNTASILPNEPAYARRYGRTILMRRNIIVDSSIVASSRAAFEAAVDARHHADFHPDGGFYRTLWHELGHYLGPDLDKNGRLLDLALEEESGTFEEMKADLVSLFLVKVLRANGYYDDAQVRAVYASGINRMLNKNRPRPDQVYGVMQNMQLNWFLEHRTLAIDPASHKLTIDYSKYHDTVAALLAEVMAVQYGGDKAAAEKFIERWNVWDARHQALADAMKGSEPSRFRLVRYAALGE